MHDITIKNLDEVTLSVLKLQALLDEVPLETHIKNILADAAHTTGVDMAAVADERQRMRVVDRLATMGRSGGH